MGTPSQHNSRTGPDGQAGPADPSDPSDPAVTTGRAATTAGAGVSPGQGRPSAPGTPPGPPGAGRQLAPGGSARGRTAAGSGAHMVVCGDDGLAHRLAAELRTVYGEQVTLVVPPTARIARRPVVGRARTAAAFLDRMTAAVNRATGAADPTAADRTAEARARDGGEHVLEAGEATEAVLAEAGVERAAALALVYDDDETNIRAALTARRLNPRLRLVLRLYNRRLGQYIEELLDQASALAAGGGEADGVDGFGASTTVLSDADTAAPALAATAVAGTSKVVQTDGLMLRAVERPPGRGGQSPGGLCTLALLSATTNDPAGTEGSEGSGARGPQLLPDERAVAEATGRGTVVLDTVRYAGPALPPGRAGGGPLGAFGPLLSRRLRLSLAGMIACVFALAVAQMVITGEHPLQATYATLLDLFGIADPATDQSDSRQILQLLSGLMGLLLLPVLLAAVLEALGTFRSGTALRKPPRGLSGHVVLLGLGKIGTRVLARLRELHIPVVCVEEDPEARGLAEARRLRVPVILGDVTQEGVLEAAKIHRAHALLAVTSSDTTNLEAGLYARSVRPDLRVVLRLYDDDFATAVYRTLRAAHPGALTRSRSVSHLAAPAFAGAMMGRQILGAIPVERRVLLFAAVEVRGHPRLEGRTMAEAFRAGAWRVLALDTAAPGEPGTERTPGAAGSGLVWDLPPTYVLRAEDRVVLAATRRGLAELLGRRAGVGA
ncbi:Trk K+ transport system, NAD-binding component [Streptomyces sp. 1222.2]|uniref:Trk K+ transport system NAD-binding subunit n=2 Tax=Streptomyces TaxID=1883 RepID=A0A8I0PA43_9ACTN|nr:Trk K+ transport system NAD-binding subunit [Streptomyces stelliscabiei]SOD75813.1 Trk K+ transport system, NAD-binding component [Streptomyces sp. 1222.2]